jgi:hypothetical protein
LSLLEGTNRLMEIWEKEIVETINTEELKIFV